MPLKLIIGRSKKIGEPNYGSRGATVGLEVEADVGLLNQPQQLHDRIAKLFRIANESIEQELNGGKAPTVATTVQGRIAAVTEAAAKPATGKQIRAIYALAKQSEIDVVDALQSRFGVERPEELSVIQASQFIDLLKPSANGK